MSKIQKLPASVINQIAAGEVVERPSSVMKELLENAVDAGATRIDVVVERGGKDLIRIADDGSGMSAEDLELAFQPHATSKLHTAQDLERIHTLGFRGEALAAIAEISKVRCQSRTADSDNACCIEIEGGLLGDIRNAPGAVGTVFEVRDLFFNTPVRRRFLKSDTTEAGHVVEAFQRVALAQPNIHMTYRSGNKQVYDIPAQAGLKERIGIFYGKELIDDLIWIDTQADDYRVFGYVANPSHSRGTSRSQNFYVGGRFVRDRTLSHALTEAYRGLLMVGRQPVAFLKLELPPDEVDVNVHPAKVEVRFRDSQKLYALLLSAIRQKFLASDLHEKLSAHGQGLAPGQKETASPTAPPAITNSKGYGEPIEPLGERPSLTLQASSPNRQMVTDWFSTSPSGASGPLPGTVPPQRSAQFDRQSLSGFPPQSNYGTDPAYQKPDPAATLPGGSWSMSNTSSQPFEADLDLTNPATSADSNDQQVPRHVDSQQAGPQADASAGAYPQESRRYPEPDPRYRNAVQIHDSYIVVETADGVSLVDQHALHERILYEELRLKIKNGGVEAQRLLIPDMLELEPADHALALEHADVLAQLGLEVQDYGEPTLAVLSIPVLARHLNAGELARDLIDRFRHSQAKPDPEAIINLILATIACKAAVKAGDKLRPDEISALLAKGEEFSESHHCPHGRPSALVFTRNELEKQFGRI